MLNVQAKRPLVVYLDYTHRGRMHMGDMLFFLDIVWCLIQSNIKVAVVGHDDLNCIFSVFGVEHVGSFDLIDEPGVVLTKYDAFYSLRRYRELTLVGFDFWQVPGNGRIASDILAQVRMMFQSLWGVTLVNRSDMGKQGMFDGVFRAHFDAMSSHNASSVVVINSYIESGIWGYYSQLKRFNAHVQQLKSDDASISFVCVGSLNDAKKPLPISVDRDLRGQLTIEQLVHFFATEHIACVVTFDTFIAHLAVLFGCKVQLMARSKRKQSMIVDRFVPFYDAVADVECV